MKKYLGTINHIYRYTLEAKNQKDALYILHKIVAREYFAKDIPVTNITIRNLFKGETIK